MARMALLIGEPTAEDLSHADSYFVGDEFIKTYLNPMTSIGCALHKKPECLCDVDVSLTADLTWDQCPAQLIGINTEAELVEAAANIWLNYDLLRNFQGIMPALADHPRLGELLEVIKADASVEAAKAIIEISDKTYIYLRKVFGLSRDRKQVPANRVLELAAEGVSPVKAQQILFEESGILYSLSAMRHVRERAGLPAKNRKYPADRILELHASGFSIKEICSTIAQEGVTDPKTEGVAYVLRRQRAKMSPDEAT